ncbi:hypothetical protein D3C84_627800 [compost metagenome]
MIEPEFLSVPELAERWKQTPRQIIDHAVSLRLALYFLFDGLAFDFDNYWYSSTGAPRERREFAHLTEWIESSEASLKRNAMGLTGKFDSMGEEDVMQLRTMINHKRKRLEELRRILDEREAKIKQFHYRGHLRVGPETLTNIARNGETPHPSQAYHPDFPVSLRKSDQCMVLDGQIMRLESYGDWKPKLVADDLLASMREIKTLETSSTSSSEATTKHVPKQLLQEQAVIAALRQLGYAPEALPKRVAGSEWVKAKAWRALSERKDLFTEGTFAKAWERLRSSGEIAEQQ